MGSSAKKKKDKKKDFTKPKLKVGKTRPKNTNATDTSFASKSITFKQQNLSSSTNQRGSAEAFLHHLSLLSSRNEAQRRDALAYLASACSTGAPLPQAPAAVLVKAQPLILDASPQVRQQLLKLFRALPVENLGQLDQLLLYTRAGLAHLSTDIRGTSLLVLDWLLEGNAEGVFACAGGWVGTLRTFLNLLGWHAAGGEGDVGGWKGGASASTSSLQSSSKLRVHQLSTLSHLLTQALTPPPLKPQRDLAAATAAAYFPLWHTDAHSLPAKASPFAYLNLFGAERDVEGGVYADAEERAEVLGELDLLPVFQRGVRDAKREGGEVGRAAAGVEKALRLVGDGG